MVCLFRAPTGQGKLVKVREKNLNVREMVIPDNAIRSKTSVIEDLCFTVLLLSTTCISYN
jgi:hypothetical protein